MRKKIKVLILGEGPTDVGTDDGAGGWLKGCIMCLLEKVNDSIDIEFFPAKKRSLPTTLPRIKDKKFEGHGKNVQKLIIYSKLNKTDCDVVVYFGDTDKESGSKNTLAQVRKASKTAYDQAYEAFEYFNEIGIAIIPLRMLESWLLADENAFDVTFGKNLKLPRFPELLWGDKRDPNSNHPKRFFEKKLQEAGVNSSRENYCDLMQNMNLEVLSQKCPISFGPFIIAAGCEQTLV